jgi:signal transduction histidine kinase/ligand-binding sensor domain-containing protein/CheY-like chemotaxis protein
MSRIADLFHKSSSLLLTLLILLCFSAAQQTTSQNNKSLKINHYSSSHKLPGASIQCMYQDKIGIFWLGIESEGLTKYDGKTFTVYKNDPNNPQSISNNYPIRIAEDDNGDLWVTTLNGLNKFDRKSETFTRFIHQPNNKNSIANNVLNGIQKDQFGFLWIATANGVSIINPERNECFNIMYNDDVATPVRNIETTQVLFDTQNNAWIGSQLHGLFFVPENAYKPIFKRWQNQSITEINESITNIVSINDEFNDAGPNTIRSMAFQGTDTLWLGTQTGLYWFNIKSRNLAKKEFNLSAATNINKATILKLFFDNRGNMWVGTSNDGLIVLSTKTNETYYSNADQYVTNQLKSNAIRDIFESKSGLVWIATKFGGLHYYDRRQETFQLIKKAAPGQQGLSDDFVMSLLEDSRKNFWIGTKNGGINIYDRNRQLFKTISTESTKGALKSNRIEMMVEDENGYIWLATEAGLAKLNPLTYQINYYNNLHVRNLAYTKDGYIWLGTGFGVFRFSPATGALAPVKTKHGDFFDIESNIYITRIFEDRFGTLWLGTSSNGLYEYHSANDSLIWHIHSEQDTNSISGNLVRAIHENKNGDLWIGTKSDGLNRYDRKTGHFECFTNAQELPSNTIYSILEDDNGIFWMGTHNGIVKFNSTTKEFSSFGTNYGLQSLIFEINAYSALHDGIFAVGGSQGLNLFDPKKVERKSYHAPIIISKFAVANKELAKDINKNATFELSHGSNYLTFEFALLDFSEPDANKYAFYLENFDETWIYSGNRNFVTYTNLPAGEYVFRVKGANSDGDWTKDEIAINITIPTPFVKSGWFLTLLLLVAATSLYMYFSWRSKRTKRLQNQLKELVDKRTIDLTEANTKLEDSKIAIMQRNEELLRKSKQIITQNQELEKHRRHLELLVKARTKDLEESKLKAEESDQLKSAFLANMSHEIRTPLNAIMGFLDILEDNELPNDDKKKITHIIQSNGTMLLQLINDIIDISLIEANQVILHWAPIEFKSFINSICEDYSKHKELMDKNIKLQTITPQTSHNPTIYAAPERVKQVYCNLINNAIKFTSHGSISFGYEIETDTNTIKCFVKDTGCGIPQKDVDVIFNRFRKLDHDNTIVHRGTGLGLAICKNLCEMMGGSIWVESEINKGSTFYFRLPLNRQNAGDDSETDQYAKENIEVPVFINRTILVAEDEESNYEVIKYILRKTQINIVRAHDGLEAVETVLDENQHFDIVLMDIKMPRLNGIEATKFIKEAFPNLPVIALTAYALQNEKTNFNTVGLDAYLTKPINANELYAAMEQLIAKKPLSY